MGLSPNLTSLEADLLITETFFKISIGKGGRL
jgi:hypothetical protein